MTYHNVDPAAVSAVKDLAKSISELARAIQSTKQTPEPEKQQDPPRFAFCSRCAGPFMHLMDETGGHWDTCPNRARRDPACTCHQWTSQRVYPGTDGFKHSERCPVAEGNQ